MTEAFDTLVFIGTTAYKLKALGYLDEQKSECNAGPPCRVIHSRQRNIDRVS